MHAHWGRARESGQATAEYVLVTAGVAIACIAALIFVLKPLDGIFSDPRVNTPSGQPLTPPVSGEPLNVPKTLDDCAGQHWRQYNLGFFNRADCQAYVRAHE